MPKDFVGSSDHAVRVTEGSLNDGEVTAEGGKNLAAAEEEEGGDEEEDGDGGGKNGETSVKKAVDRENSNMSSHSYNHKQVGMLTVSPLLIMLPASQQHMHAILGCMKSTSSSTSSQHNHIIRPPKSLARCL
jgi:hypothetical protein